MHELSIAENILSIITGEAKKYNLKKIKEITVKAGELAGIVPENLIYCFEIISKGSIAEGAEIKIERVPLKVLCLDCGEEFVASLPNIQCVKCGSRNLKIVGGKEFFIESMEGE
ncbi:hydrogenase nickel insertion protein HypA [Thermoanaerobacter kivui]|uniref:Hydrogenase maturation factor HypA n=1 Tax=Thermoanaerobacter kivui TaxID=2325 RepID=A0A097ANE6_THEKI|nr:hydrogenase maturation nickel metallochaperone HypA [Thermoanaerobacter kivui]AIS51338.1 hydrogenase nickel insertion protein HypA [Thermoanaerobacter kivui]